MFESDRTDLIGAVTDLVTAEETGLARRMQDWGVRLMASGRVRLYLFLGFGCLLLVFLVVWALVRVRQV